jgi:glycosyltransferase involved in cell wall biosynthesis
MQKTKAPLVSVIMNCFNGETYLQEAINSVYSQAYTNWEIVFWDNLSVDSSAKIAKSYNGKLNYFASDKHTSLGEARVNAIKKAKGEYLAFLDCDDLWENDKLMIQVSSIDNNNEIGFIYSRCELISGKGDTLGFMPNNIKMSSLPSGEIFDDLIRKGCFIAFNSILISKKIYEKSGGFPIHYKNSIDYHLYLKIAYEYKVLAIDKIVCQSREHGKNLSYSQYVIGAEENIESIELFFPDERAILGVKYHYANLIVCLIREYKVFRAISTLFTHGGWLIVSKRAINKLCNSW